MSTVYNLEPPTKGKVLLKTTKGDIDIELWPKEAPKAVRNFVQLCLEGYFDGCIFHRVIPNFLIQTGDPTGEGTGGSSAYGKPFKDEFHSRLKFNHRGLVACANENEPNTNSSQFFITLDRADWLDKKNTIFGKVTGETIYNVTAIGEVDIDEDDRPLDPPRVLETEVLWNPFDDIVPRTTKEEREAAAAAQKADAEQKQARAAKKSKKKDFALLSFGEEAGAEEQELSAMAREAAIRSAHDVIQDSRLLKDDSEQAQRLAQTEAELEAERQRARASVRSALTKKGTQNGARPGTDEAGPSGGGAADTDEGFDDRMRAAAMARRTAMGDSKPARPAKPPSPEKASSSGGSESESDEEERDGPARRREAMREDAMKSGRMQAAIARPSRHVKVEDSELLTDWQRRIQHFKQLKRITGDRQKDTMEQLKKFTAALRTGGAKAAAAAKPAGDAGGGAEAGPGSEAAGAAPDEGYAGRVRQDLNHDAYQPAAWRADAYLEGEEDDGLDALRGHKLVFPKAGTARDAMARTEHVDDYEVVDPLQQRDGKTTWNKADARAKKRGREWAGGAIS